MKLIPAPAKLALVLSGIVTLAGCSLGHEDPKCIDVRPSYPVRYATDRISPAVVRLDIVSENFQQGQARSERSIGSGVIIDDQGHVLTNFHVAGRAKRIDITLSSLEHVRANLLGSDHWTDLALVQLDMDEVHRRHLTFSHADLGDSSKVMLAQPVMAVGTPYGLSRTVTAGIVSNTDRTFDESDIDGYETGWFNNWIQTDAAINPGNSGGPLVDLRGDVVGINTRGMTTGNNLGFAIPIDVAKDVIRVLMNPANHGKVARSYIGVQLQPLQDFEKFYDIAIDKGVLVASVENDSPAAIAGIKAEDIVLAIDGVPVNVRFPEQLAPVRRMISDYPIGSDLTLTVQRPGKPEPMTVKIKTEKLESVITEEQAISAWGLSVRDLTRAYLRDNRIPYTHGVLVTGSRPGSPAQAAEIDRDDIILKVDGKPVTSVEDLQAAAEAWSKNPRPIGIDIRRGRGQIFQVLKPRD
ncbi:MAG TPA: trypsin-like peptidase domain-containing protein [Phycisphaerae bacterium]|nr:trypsin-like peptidase domain-containing protein [Phycisphaerae bacterium]